MTDSLHDDAVSRRYRELPPEEPPRALDEAILAASRRAAGARPVPRQDSPWTPTDRRRWYVPLAAAAAIVLAAGLGLHLQLERPEVEDVTPPSPTVLAAPPPQEARPKVAEAKPPPQKQSAEPAPAQARGDSAQPFKDESLARAAPAAPAPPERSVESRPMSAPKPQAMEAPAPAAGARADDASRESARQSRDRAEQSVASSAMAKRSMAIEETPEKALERIAELRKAGKDDEADRALAEFRKRYPDFRISDEMKAKIERR